MSQKQLWKPQHFPNDWRNGFEQATFPTEEVLTRSWMDDEYFEEHKLGINTHALVYAAVRALSKQSTPTIASMGSGGWNALFCIEFPDGDKILARIPKIGGRSTDKIHSTVAMMTMARYHLQLPVPEIFAWHPSNDNPVGAPYMLLEFVDGIEPWQRWFTLAFKGQITMLNELAKYHAKFASPLPFKGIGSIFFATSLPDTSDVADASTYRLGTMSHGHPFTSNREISDSSSPLIHTTNLREFWQREWQRECDHITRTHGVDRETVIADDKEGQTVGAFLDVAEHLKTLICNASLPTQPEFYEPCLAMTDYAFRNIKIDPETLRVISFLDWDDVYVFPFLLCSRFPEDICFFDGSGEPWHKTGAFTFVPLDEEQLDSDHFDFEDPMDDPQCVEHPAVAQTDDCPSEDDEPADVEDQSDKTCSEESVRESPKASPASLPDEADELESDRKRRIRDTLLRREYARLLAKHDPRYGLEGFFTLRTEPMKIHYLIMNGWKSWLQKDEWMKERPEEIRRQSM